MNKLTTTDDVLRWVHDCGTKMYPTYVEVGIPDRATAARIAENERLRQWMEVWRADMDARGLPQMDWWEVAMRAALDEEGAKR